MASRPRTRTRKDWPKGLRETRPGYFIWEHGGTAKAIGRTSLADAKMQAMEANIWAEQQTKARLVDRLTNDGDTLGQWLTKWADKLELDGKLAPNTVKSYRTSANAVTAEIGDTPIAKVTVKHIADALEEIEEARGARTAQACRAMLKTAFTAAMAKGLVSDNPALMTAAVSVSVRRQRFTWETFSKVWAELADAPAWIRNATALALVSGQRREDVAVAAFEDFDAEQWGLVQAKTGHKLAIPLDLRLNVLDMSLRDVLTACRRTGVVSRHLIHQTRGRPNSPTGAPLVVDRLSKAFSDAVERALGPGENLPTFHELRSLCKRLYQAQGGVDTKALLGHSTDQSAELYGDARGAEFVRVKIA